MMENKQPEFAFNVQRILDSVFYVEEAINTDPPEVKISYGLAFFVSVEESWVQYNVSANFCTAAGQIFATGTVVTKFGISNLSNFVDNDSNVIWPANSLEAMFSIAFSHMRALLYKNMAGTKFSNYIVPLINPIEVFKQLMQSMPDFQQVSTKKGTTKPKSQSQPKKASKK